MRPYRGYLRLCREKGLRVAFQYACKGRLGIGFELSKQRAELSRLADDLGREGRVQGQSVFDAEGTQE